MINDQVRSIKHAQKESLFLKTMSQIIMQLGMDDSELCGLMVNRVRLSDDKGTCFVLFYCVDGEKDFKKKLSKLVLYKPSIRKALSSLIKGRYTPDLQFQYDSLFEKQNKIEMLLDQIKNEESPEDEEPSE